MRNRIICDNIEFKMFLIEKYMKRNNYINMMK